MKNEIQTEKEKLLNIKHPERLNFYTVEQTANCLQVSKDSVWNWIKQGSLLAYDICPTASYRMYRIAEADLVEFITRKDPQGMERILKQRKQMMEEQEINGLKAALEQYHGAMSKSKPETNNGEAETKNGDTQTPISE